MAERHRHGAIAVSERARPTRSPGAVDIQHFGAIARLPIALDVAVCVASMATPPRAEGSLSAGELATAAGISEARLARLVRLGLVEPTASGVSRFTAATAARLRRMLRLHHDLGVMLVGAAIVVDLLERLDRLERGLARATAPSDNTEIQPPAHV